MGIARVTFKTEMETERALALLESTPPSLLKLCEFTEAQDTAGKVMIAYLMDCRRKQKIMCEQYGPIDNMLKFIAGLESAKNLLNEPCPPKLDPNASTSWKALKAEYLEQIQEMEQMIGTLVEPMEEILKKRQKLEALLVALVKKKEVCKEQERAALQLKQSTEKRMTLQLEDSLQRAHNALRVCDRQLSELKSQVAEHLARVSNWTAFRDRLQATIELTQAYIQYRLLSGSPSELCLEVLFHSTQQALQLQPLRLSVAISSNDHFRLQVFQGTAGLIEESVEGHERELSAALLEVMECYLSQGKMLAEIQALHLRFAIDWCPAKRLLIFLKSATTVCQLELDEGYPLSGHAKLLSVHKDGSLLNLSALQLPMMNPSLTVWLEFLSSSPEF